MRFCKYQEFWLFQCSILWCELIRSVINDVWPLLVNYNLLFFSSWDSSAIRSTPYSLVSSSDASQCVVAVVAARVGEGSRMVWWSNGTDVFRMLMAMICLGSPILRVWEGCFSECNWMGCDDWFWRGRVGDVEDGFLVWLESVLSGDSHLRFRRESWGMFLILSLYSVGVGGCVIFWRRVVGRVKVGWSDERHYPLNAFVDFGQRLS